MPGNLRDAMNKHRAAAEDLHRVLRECLGELTAMRGEAGELRLQVIEGGRQVAPRKTGAQRPQRREAGITRGLGSGQ